MQELQAMRERFDNTIYDTHAIESGQTKNFLGAKNIGDDTMTSMRHANVLPPDQTFAVSAIGLSVVGKSRKEEKRVLDHLFVTLVIGDKPYGPYPGSLCSTYRTFVEGGPPWWRLWSRYRLWRTVFTGYVLLLPLMIPVRQRLAIRVEAARTLPEPVVVRSFLFGLKTRNAQ